MEPLVCSWPDREFTYLAVILPTSYFKRPRVANDSRFGLAASVWGDPGRAEEVAARMTAGMIGVNRGCGGAEGSPWVGALESGYGWHSGKYGHRQFCQIRTISRGRSKGEG